MVGWGPTWRLQPEIVLHDLDALASRRELVGRVGVGGQLGKFCGYGHGPRGGVVSRLVEEAEGQVLVSQNRWVDHLLDLYNAADSWSLHQLIEETLSDIRHVRSIEGSWIRDRLATMAAAIEVELAFGPEATLSL